MVSAGSVTLDILPNVAGLSAKMREAATLAAREASSSAKITPQVDGTAAGQRFGSGFLAEAKKVAVAAAGLFAVKEIVDFGKESVSAFTDTARAALTLNRSIGGTVEDSSRLIFAANESGVSTDRFSTSMKLLEKNVVSVGGKTPAAAGALKQLGVDANDSHGKLLPMSELLPNIAEKFAALPNGAEKSALALKLFGRGGLDLLPMLNKGKEGIAELTAESDKYGHTISGPQAAAVKANIVAQRQFNAALEGVKIQLGAQLLPIITTFTSYFRTQMLPVILSGTAFLRSHADIIATVAKVLIPLIAGYGLFLATIKKTKEAVEAAKDVYKGLKTAMDFGATVGKAVVDFAKSAASAVASAAKATAAWVASSARVVASWVAQGAAAVAQAAVSAGAWVASSARTVAALALQAVAFIAQKVIMAAGAVATGVMTAAQWALNAALDANPIGLVVIVLAALVASLIFAYTHSTTFRNIVNEAWASIKAGVSAAWYGVILPVVQAMVSFWQNVLGPAISFLYAGVIRPVWSAIAAYVTAYIGVVRGVIAAVMDAIHGNWSGVWNDIKGIVASVWGGIQGVVSAGISAVSNLFGGLGGRILGALGNLGGLLLGAGRDVIQGLINGISGAAGAVGSAISNVVGGAVSAAKSALGIQSPSRVFHEIGVFSGQGLAQGMTSMHDQVSKAGAAMATAAVPSASTMTTEAVARPTTVGTTHNWNIQSADPFTIAREQARLSAFASA